MATQPWWSVRLAQWRAAWQTQRYSPKNTFKKVNNSPSYRPSYYPNSYDRKSSNGLRLAVALCLIAGTAIGGVIFWQISHTPPTGQPTTSNNAAPPTAIPATPKPNPENYTVAKPGQLAVYWILNEGKQRNNLVS